MKLLRGPFALTREPSQGVQLTPDEEARLLEAAAEADRGETISAKELLDRLDLCGDYRPQNESPRKGPLQ